MLTTHDIAKAANIVELEYPISRIDLFGSYAENRNTPDSDVDILIEFSDKSAVTLLTLCKIKNRLEELLNTPVDVISAPVPADSMLEFKKVVQLYAA